MQVAGMQCRMRKVTGPFGRMPIDDRKKLSMQYRLQWARRKAQGICLLCNTATSLLVAEKEQRRWVKKINIWNRITCAKSWIRDFHRTLNVLSPLDKIDSSTANSCVILCLLFFFICVCFLYLFFFNMVLYTDLQSFMVCRTIWTSALACQFIMCWNPI